MFCQNVNGQHVPTPKLLGAIEATEKEALKFSLLSCLFDSSYDIVQAPEGSIAVLTEGVNRLRIVDDEGACSHEYVLQSGDKASIAFKHGEEGMVLKREWTYKRVHGTQDADM